MGVLQLPSALSRASPYGPVLANPLLRRVLGGISISSVGDGLSTIAISLLALELAPSGSEALWVSWAVASYSLPGAIGTFAFGKWLRHRSGAQLASWDAVLRATFLILIPFAHVVDALNVGTLVILLACSSLLNAWGKAGRYVLLSDLLPPEDRLAGNALINVALELAYVAGPPIAAVLLTVTDASVVIGLDGLTFAVMACIYRYGLPARLHDKRISATASRSAGFRAMLRTKSTALLVSISFLFFLFFGPVSVALPIYVVNELDASAAILAGYFTAFGLGGFVGAFGAAYLRQWPALWAGLLSILGVGFFVSIMSMPIPPLLGWLAFALAGLFWGPFPSTTTAYLQATEEGPQLASVLAARTALQVFAMPLGTLAAGPAILLIGPRYVLLAAGLGIIALALLGMLSVRVMQRNEHQGRQTSDVNPRETT